MMEHGVYINEVWHTGQVRDASAELVGTQLKVVGHLLPRVRGINPNLNRLMRAALIRKVLDPEEIPFPARSKWDRDENWVYRVIDSLRRKYTTPGRLDENIVPNLDNYGYFASPEDAVNYLDATRQRLTHLLKYDTQHRLGTLKLVFLSYTESRILRMAVGKGQYLIRSTN